MDRVEPFDANAEPEIIYTFPDATGMSGIAETERDVFTTFVGNFLFRTAQAQGVAGVSGKPISRKATVITVTLQSTRSPTLIRANETS